MSVGGERQELFTLNGSTLGEKLNKRATALIAWHRDVVSWGTPEDQPLAAYGSAVLNYSSPVDWLNASPSQCAGLSGTC
jgi:hypothetical protein